MRRTTGNVRLKGTSAFDATAVGLDEKLALSEGYRVREHRIVIAGPETSRPVGHMAD
jgi:hypothetical protein